MYNIRNKCSLRASEGKDRMTALKEHNGRTYTLTGNTTAEKRENALTYYHDNRERILREGKERRKAARVKKGKPPFGRGRYIDSHGYVVISTGKVGCTRRVKEHRYVMEQHIGRSLTTDEVVHHVNGVRDDNRIGNLQIMTRSAHSLLPRKEYKYQERFRTHPPNAKLSVEKVKAIKVSKLKSEVLAKRHGVCTSTIRHIRSGYSWSWVGG